MLKEREGGSTGGGAAAGCTGAGCTGTGTGCCTITGCTVVVVGSGSFTLMRFFLCFLWEYGLASAKKSSSTAWCLFFMPSEHSASLLNKLL